MSKQRYPCSGLSIQSKSQSKYEVLSHPRYRRPCRVSSVRLNRHLPQSTSSASCARSRFSPHAVRMAATAIGRYFSPSQMWLLYDQHGDILRARTWRRLPDARVRTFARAIHGLLARPRRHWRFSFAFDDVVTAWFLAPAIDIRQTGHQCLYIRRSRHIMVSMLNASRASRAGFAMYSRSNKISPENLLVR